MEAQYTISETEYVRANKLFTRLEKRSLIGYGLAVSILAAIAVFLPSIPIQVGALFAIVGGVLGHIVTRYIVAPWQTRKQYRHCNAVQEPVIVGLEEHGIRFKTADSEALLKWSNVRSWRENSEFVLVYQTTRLYHVIPKKVGNESFPVDRLLSELSERIGRKI